VLTISTRASALVHAGTRTGARFLGIMRKTKRPVLLPIEPRVREALDACRTRTLMSEYVLLTQERRPYSESRIKRYFKTAKLIAGITRRFRFHDQRHTFAAHWRAKVSTASRYATCSGTRACALLSATHGRARKHSLLSPPHSPDARRMTRVRRPTMDEGQAAEVRARESLEVREGAPFTDEEWQEAKTNLVNFFRILTEWQMQAEQPVADSPPAPADASPQRRGRAKKRSK
jgi:hypothetical protein